MDEQELISAAQAGDLDAFNQIVLVYQDKVFNHTDRILRDPDQAEDITQDTFIKAYHSLPDFRGGSFPGWLLRIATNASYDELRRRKRQATIPLFQTRPEGEELDMEEWLEDEEALVEEAIEQAELSLSLRRHVEALPEKYRAVLVMVDVSDLAYEEAAQALGIPVGTVKSRLARARLLLRNRLYSSQGDGKRENSVPLDWETGILAGAAE